MMRMRMRLMSTFLPVALEVIKALLLRASALCGNAAAAPRHARGSNPLVTVPDLLASR